MSASSSTHSKCAGVRTYPEKPSVAASSTHGSGNAPGPRAGWAATVNGRSALSRFVIGGSCRSWSSASSSAVWSRVSACSPVRGSRTYARESPAHSAWHRTAPSAARYETAASVVGSARRIEPVSLLRLAGEAARNACRTTRANASPAGGAAPAGVLPPPGPDSGTRPAIPTAWRNHASVARRATRAPTQAPVYAPHADAAPAPPAPSKTARRPRPVGRCRSASGSASSPRPARRSLHTVSRRTSAVSAAHTSAATPRPVIAGPRPRRAAAGREHRGPG
ncbi:hypothetical protein VSR01_15985 [Actinacidiphila sp. DG2A-62]|uniref:hypothetical protein n=1 Tax=Actinacidiphila sp. DG2A-62 TaxID=3108821 RepID=UPI002DB6CF10|nr:hypothetical protein [Actinacidiphila sp. DG2A-62]MEC3994946.1 hypothetical protein [Actinacidiphila sp. DG2A-62]